MEQVFSLKFSQTFQVQFSQRNDNWFPIPADLAMEGWSDEEVNAITPIRGQALRVPNYTG